MGNVNGFQKRGHEFLLFYPFVHGTIKPCCTEAADRLPLRRPSPDNEADIQCPIAILLQATPSTPQAAHTLAAVSILAPYAIGCFPVTNAEYACFMKDSGYTDERHWTEGGRCWLRGEKVPGEDDPADWWLQTWRRFKADPGELDRLVASGQMTRRDADNPWRILIAWSEAQA